MSWAGSHQRAFVRRTSAFFCVSLKRAGPDSEDFPGKAIGILVVMDTSSVHGGSEDDRGRDREIIFVSGSPNGSESMSCSMSQVSQPAARSRAIDWFSVGTWFNVSEEEVLKNCEEIMVACIRIAGGMPEFKFPKPTFKKIGPYMRKSVGF